MIKIHKFKSKALILFGSLSLGLSLLLIPGQNVSNISPGDSSVKAASLTAAPNFTLKDANGKNLSLKNYKGKTVILNFWGTWCPYCVEEMPLFQKLNSSLPKNYVILAVNSGDDLGLVKKFIKKYNYGFKVLQGTDAMVNGSYKVVDFPTTILIDKNGNIIRKSEGAFKTIAVLKTFANIK